MTTADGGRTPANGARPVLDVASLANHLGVTERSIRRLVAERRVPFCKIEKFVRFDLFEIETWLNERRVSAADRY